MTERPRTRTFAFDHCSSWKIAAWKEMLIELVESRELIWRLFLRDFRAKYRQTFLGVLWAIIMPVVAVGTFVFLNRAGIFNIGDTKVPYPVYAILGLTLWQLFAGGLAVSCNSIVAAGSMVGKINFPKETLVLSSFGQTAVDALIRLAVTIVVFAYYRVTPAKESILILLAIMPLLLFTLACGFFLSLLNSLFRDISNIVNLGTTFLLLITPILYQEPTSGLFNTINEWNPLSVLVCTPRDLILEGTLSHPYRYAGFAVFSVFLFLISWRVFHIVEYRIAERVGAR